jgi:hypothetical protein
MDILTGYGKARQGKNQSGAQKSDFLSKTCYLTQCVAFGASFARSWA